MIVALVLFLGLVALGVALTRRQREATQAATKAGGEVRMIDPKELLFAIPTLHDDIPPVDTTASFSEEPHAALMHEDDWRQDEFIPVAARAFVTETLGRLQSHRAVHARGVGFREVLIRSESPVSLATARIHRDDLRAVLGDTPPTPLYLQSSSSTPARVRDGFTFPMPDVGFVYGRIESGYVTALGLALVGSSFGPVAPLAAMSERYRLLFVDWVGGVVIEAGDERGFRAWLNARRAT
jgi:hypothetical protein